MAGPTTYPTYQATKANGVRNGRGRPCGLTPEVHDAIVKAFGLGATVEIAVGAAGVTTATFYRWMKQGREDESAGESSIFRDFCEAVERARHTGDLQLLASVRSQTQGRRCATCGGQGSLPSHQAGGRANDNRLVRCPACHGSGFGTTPDGRLALDVLSRRHPEAFGRKDQARIEHSGPQGGPIQVGVASVATIVDLAQLSPDQLGALGFGQDVIEATAPPASALPPARTVTALPVLDDAE